MIDTATNIIPSQNARSIRRAVMSTCQRLTGPIMVFSVCVAQARGSPYSMWTLSGQSNLVSIVTAKMNKIVHMIKKDNITQKLLFVIPCTPSHIWLYTIIN